MSAALTALPACRPHMPENERGEGAAEPSLNQRALAAVAGAVVGERLVPGGALIGAAAVPYLEVLARRAWDEFRPDSQRRQAEMLGAAAQATGQGPEGLAGLTSKSERTRLLTATAMVGAAGTAWPPKVAALGRALADGLIADDEAQVNIADLVIPAMSDMDRPHVALLELLVKYVPVGETGPVRAKPYDESRDQFTRGGFNAGDFARSGWTAGWRRWTAYQIGEVRPTLEPVLTSLIGTLERHGLADQHDSSASMLAKYSKAIREETSRKGLRAGQRITASALLPPEVSEMDALGIAPPTAWSPTELGERVLGFYELAAADGDSGDAPSPDAATTT